MGYIKRKTDKRVVVFDDAGGEPTGDLNSLLTIIRSARQQQEERVRRMQKNKKKNQQRGT